MAANSLFKSANQSQVTMLECAANSQIIIADDQKLIRQGICSLLSGQAGMKVVGESDEGPGLQHLIRQRQPDVVIMSVNKDCFDRIEMIRQLVREFENVKVIALSGSVNRLLVSEILLAGASGFLLKQCGFEELLQAILTVMDNQVYVCSQVAEVLRRPDPSESAYSEPANIAVLTSREREILRLLSEGKSTK